MSAARAIPLTAFRALVWFGLLLALLAGLDAGPELARQRYPQQGLWLLCSDLLRAALRSALLPAALGGLVIGALPLARPSLAPIVGSRLALALAALSGAAMAALSLLSPGSPEAPGPRPNIVLITVDTLRADHLGAYGYARPTSPAIDRLASQGVLFRRAVSQAQWTLPSMASVHSGLYAYQHGASRANASLGPQVLTLAELLRNSGYRTLAVVSHLFVGSRYGFRQGMEFFDESQVRGHDAVTSEALTQIASRLARGLEDGPYFLWVHYFDPHFSYVRHPEYDFAGRSYKSHVKIDEVEERLASFSSPDGSDSEAYMRDVRAIYDEEIAHTDLWIGHLVEQLRSAFPSQPLVIVFTADHGELFLEHGEVGHARGLWEELIHVPLIISGDLDPELRGRQVERNVETASIGRTILDLAGVERPSFPGENLLALDPNADPRPTFSEGSYAWSGEGRSRAVMSGGWKLIHDIDEDEHQLYHLASDPGEKRNLWNEPGGEVEAVRRRLRAELDALVDYPETLAGPVVLDAEERRMLEEIGYLVNHPELIEPSPPPPGPAPD